MSSCLSGGGRTFRLDLEIIKSPTTSWASANSSSPSSTLSESRSSPVSISTRKPRTPRKRPNQIYNEAASILSTAYPKLFPTKHLSKPRKFPNQSSPFLFQPSDLLIPLQAIDSPACMLNCPQVMERFKLSMKPKGLSPLEKTCQSPGEISSHNNNSLEICNDYREDFDAESMLDEEIGDGIDSIMGQLSMENKPVDDSDSCTSLQKKNYYGYPVGLGFDFGYGIRKELRAMRSVDEADWWRFPTVNVADKTRRISQMHMKKKNPEPDKENSLVKASSQDSSTAQTKPGGLLLKLNYDEVLSEWAAERGGSPFCLDAQATESNDVRARLSQIDLFPEKGSDCRGILVGKEKRRTRPLPKKICCQVRKPKPDQRPRLMGRCVRKPNCPKDEVD